MARKPTLLSRVAALALAVARRKLPDYSCPKSPHRYTQPQLMAVLVLRAFTRQTYRGIVELLEESDGLRRVLGLDHVPRHTTLEEFASRVASVNLLEGLTAGVLVVCQENGLVAGDLAADSTGLSASPASAHYLGRGGGRRYRPWVKLSLAVICPGLMLAGFVVGQGPSPPVARGGFGVIKTPWRSRMAGLFNNGRRPEGYTRRLSAESFHSGLKRSTGDKLTARSDIARHTEAALRLLAYQIRRA